MSRDRRSRAFLDASVLYPALLRNLLIRLAIDGLYRVFWSRRVQEEWTRALFRDRPELRRESIERTRRLMEEAVEDAMVVGHEPLIEGLVLPDANDRHVLAAAIHCRARVIVTANLRDFPEGTLAPYDIEALHPDAFIVGLLAGSPNKVLCTIRRLRQSFANPPMTPIALLAAMSRQGLSESAEELSGFLDAL